MKKLLIVFVAIACTGMAGCSDKGAGGEGKGTELKASVVAQVGDDKITEADIEEIVSHIPAQYRPKYASDKGRREIVDGLVDIKTLAWEARRRGIDKQDAVRMKISYITDQILAKEIESEMKKSANVTDADIEKYYNEHQDKYVSPERIKASHILLDNEDQAKDVLKQIRGGAKFENLAKQSSKCPSAKRDGDLGWFGKGKMAPEFEKAAYALKKGEVSGVVKSSFGYHVIRLDDRKETKTRTLDQVKKSIERIIQRERRQKEVDELKERIKKEAGVSVNEDYFKKFEGMPEPEPQQSMPMMPPASPDMQE